MTERALWNEIRVIGFDADDTLWINENFFREAEAEFAALLGPYASEEEVIEQLYATEFKNIPMYGYGIKGFVLSLMETAQQLAPRALDAQLVGQILDLGKAMLQKPVELLPHVHATLSALAPHYRLILATKGDLRDQERKLKESGLADYFHHVEIMSDKRPGDYQKLLRHLDLPAAQFLMVGNSMKSDILPVVELGGTGVHVPYAITWAHEVVHEEVVHERVFEVESLSDLIALFVK